MNKKILLSHINYYQVKKGFFRNRLPGPQTTWPRVSSGMRKLIVFTEGLLSLDVELTQAQRIRLLHILRYLKENGKKKLTGQIFDDLQGRLTIRHSNVPPRVLSHNIITNSLTGETHLSTIEEIELTQDEQIIYLKEGNLILNDLATDLSKALINIIKNKNLDLDLELVQRIIQNMEKYLEISRKKLTVSYGMTGILEGYKDFFSLAKKVLGIKFADDTLHENKVPKVLSSKITNLLDTEKGTDSPLDHTESIIFLLKSLPQSRVVNQNTLNEKDSLVMEGLYTFRRPLVEILKKLQAGLPVDEEKEEEEKNEDEQLVSRIRPY